MLCNRHGILGQLHFKNKLTEKEIRFVVTRGRGRVGGGGWGGGRNWMKVVERYKLPAER